MKPVESKFENPEVVKAASGFTLVELLIVIAILGVLATITFPLIEPMRARAERVVCIANIRSLHVSIGSYLAEHQRWPQLPEETTDEGFDAFWLATTKPYGATEKTWLCPSIRRTSMSLLREAKDRDQLSKLNYLPTDFDDKPITPHEYPSHPWLMEIGSMHGRGNIIIRADGGVRELNDVLQEAAGG